MVRVSKRSRVICYGSAALLVLVGIAAAIAIGGTFGQVFAFVLIGLGFVLATALVFLEVGLSEDRERAREGAEKRRRQQPAQPRRRSALDRRRGRRRELE